jgi:translation initiation factor IF-2
LSIKLHEATKKFKISNKLAMFFLEKKDVPVKSHSSVISMEQLELLREFSSSIEKYSKIVDEFNNIGKKKKKKLKKVVKEESTKEKKVKEKEIIEEIPKIKLKKETIPEKKKELKNIEKDEIAVEKDKIDKKVEKKEIVQKKEELREKEKKEIKRREKKELNLKQPEPEKEKKKEKTHDLKKQKTEELNLPKIIKISDLITLKEFCEKLNIKLKHVEEKIKCLKKEYLSNDIIDVEDVKEICKQFNVKVEITSYEDYIFFGQVEKNKAKFLKRSPVVTVMGHVDHGKTTLLDSLRKTRIADREAGGITQKIGAYKLSINGSDIIFIDTPGHEAFTNLRVRGAEITDIIVLVVAANDGVKPQTIEAINHAFAAGVPIIVAINKIDMDNADSDKVKQELSQNKVLVEEWGGDVVCVEISAKFNKNLNSLLEMIILVAEMQELKSYKDVPARGTVIESRLDTNLGPMGSILIQDGNIKTGDCFICGNSIGKIKCIFNDRGKTINYAEAPIPVEIMGFENLPDSGDRFQIIDNIEKAKKIIDLRKLRQKETRKDEIFAEKKLSLQNLFKKMEDKKIKSFPIIIKTDSFGSGEVIEEILLKQSIENLKVVIVHKSIGNISESDILLASTSGSIIIGFNVKASQRILMLAKREKIEIKLYNVVYHLIEDIEKSIKGEMEPEYIESQIGKVEIIQKFKISKLGIVAGCLVKEGKVTNKSKLKVIRGNDLVFEGEIESLRRIKDEVKEVNAGTECGIRIKNFNAIEINDILEVYEILKKE